MITDQITPEQKAVSPFFPGFRDNPGVGLRGFDGYPAGRDRRRSGAIRLDGGTGISWYADPAENLHAIPFTQVEVFPAGIYEAFWTSVYQAIDD